MSRVFRDLNSRLKKNGDQVEGALSFSASEALIEGKSEAARLKAVHRVGDLDLTGAGAVSVLYNAEIHTLAQGYVHILAGTAMRVVYDNSGIRVYASPTLAAGAAASFSLVSAVSPSGVMTAGVVPVSRTTRARLSSQSAAITVLATVTPLVDLDVGTVSVGDIISVESWVRILKGAAAGKTTIVIGSASGTAVFETLHNRTDLIEILDHGNATELDRSLTGTLRVTAAGTLVLRLAGYSAGSNSTVAAGGAQLTARILRDS